MEFKIGDAVVIHGSKGTSADCIRMNIGVPFDLPDETIFTITDARMGEPIDTYALTYFYCDIKYTVEVYTCDLGVFFQKCNLTMASDEPQGSKENIRVYTVTSRNTIHGFTIGQEIVIDTSNNEVVSGGCGIVSNEFLEKECVRLPSLANTLGVIRCDSQAWKNLHSWVKHYGSITQEMLEAIDKGLRVHGVYTYVGAGLGDWFENSEEARRDELVGSMRCLTDSSGFLLKSSDLRAGVYVTELMYKLGGRDYNAVITPETLAKLFVKVR